MPSFFNLMDLFPKVFRPGIWKLFKYIIKQKKKHNLPEEVLIERYRQIFISVNDNQDPLFISSFIKNMPLRDSKYFMKNYAAALPGVDFTFEAECSNCETINKGGVPVGLNFFYPEQ